MFRSPLYLSLFVLVFVVLLLPFVIQAKQFIPPIYEPLSYCDPPTFLTNGSGIISGKNVVHSYRNYGYATEIRVYDLNQQRDINLNLTPQGVDDYPVDIVQERYIAVIRNPSSAFREYILMDLGQDKTAGTSDDQQYLLYNQINHGGTMGISNSFVYWTRSYYREDIDFYWCNHLNGDCQSNNMSNITIPYQSWNPGGGSAVKAFGPSSNPTIFWERYLYIMTLDRNGNPAQLYNDTIQHYLADIDLNETTLLFTAGNAILLANLTSSNYSINKVILLGPNSMWGRPSFSQTGSRSIIAWAQNFHGLPRIQVTSTDSDAVLMWDPPDPPFLPETGPSVDDNRIVFTLENPYPRIYMTQCYFGV